MTKIQRFSLLYLILFLVIGCSACGDWIGSATSIIQLLGPAISAALALLAAFGVGVSPEVFAQFQKWSTEAVATLNGVVKPLLDELKAAEDSAKPALLDKIQAAVQVIADELVKILPAIHVTNPGTQAKIAAIFQLILAQLIALINLVPVLQNKVTGHAALRAVKAVKSDKDFKREFNDLADDFGQEYTI